MPIAALTGKDTIVIAGRTLINFADGDVATIEYPNDLFTVKRGKNGNTMYSLNANGSIADVQLRLLRGSPDDAFMNQLLKLAVSDPPTFLLLTGLFIKRIGDGQQNVQNDQYILAGGIFKKKVPVKENVEGETDQAVSVYMLVFGNDTRALM